MKKSPACAGPSCPEFRNLEIHVDSEVGGGLCIHPDFVTLVIVVGLLVIRGLSLEGRIRLNGGDSLGSRINVVVVINVGLSVSLDIGIRIDADSVVILERHGRIHGGLKTEKGAEAVVALGKGRGHGGENHRTGRGDRDKAFGLEKGMHNNRGKKTKRALQHAIDDGLKGGVLRLFFWLQNTVFSDAMPGKSGTNG